MKHSRLIATLFSCFLGAQLFAQQLDSTLIEAQIEGLQAGKIKIVGTFGDQNYIADSTVADDKSHFVLRRQKALSPGFYTFLLPGNKNFSILLDRDDQRFKLDFKLDDIVNSMKIEGNGLNTDLLYRNFKFQTAQEPELNQLAATMKKFGEGTVDYKNAKEKQAKLMAERKAHLDEIFKAHPNAIFTKFKIAGQNPDIIDFRKPNGTLDTLRQLLDFRGKFWDGVDFGDDRLLHTPVVANKLRRYIKELTPQHPDSLIKVSDAIIRKVLPNKQYFKFFANWIALQYENTKTNVMDGEAVYVHIVNNFFTNELAFWSNPKEIESLRKHVWEMEASLLGRKGPDVRALDLNGQYKSIYEIQSPLVVVFMYSPDCEHCQKDAPVVQQIYEKWKSRGVEFYGIALDTDDAKWKAFAKKNGFTFTNVYDPTNRAIYAKYFVDITPELYLLNKDRIIVAKNLKPEQLEEVFERELRKLEKSGK